MPPEFVGLRMIEPSAWRERYRAFIDDLRERVSPLLSGAHRGTADMMFSGFLDDERTSRFAPGLIHHDLGPEHVLISSAGDLTGVIDWGDAEIGDPAADFAWLLLGMPTAGERALAAYGGEADGGFRDRARFYHRLGAVARGPSTAWRPASLGSSRAGLAGVRERLAI